MTESRVNYSGARRSRSRRRRRRLVALVVVLLVAALAAFAGYRLFGPDSSSADAPDAARLVTEAADAMGAEGLTMHVASKADFAAKVGDSSTAGAMEFGGDMVAPNQMRVRGTLTLPDLPRSAFEMVTVDNGATVYMQVDAVPGGWQRLPAETQPTDIDPRADLLRSVAAAKNVTIVRSEKFNGHECDVVELQLDVAALEASDAGLDLTSSLTNSLQMGPKEISAALAKAAGKRTLWIGKSDHLVYKDQTSIKVDGGKLGAYEESEIGIFSAFGKPIAPPIEVPADVK